MSRISSSDTKPEKMVRSFFHKNGLRFRLKSNLIGKPDIFLKKYNVAIFIHGCFWHRHKNCKRASMPKSNLDYWESKFSKNVERDKKIKKALQRQGIKVYIIWECECRDGALLISVIDKIKKESKNAKQT